MTSNKSIIKICPVCGKEFTPRRSDKKYCSGKCRERARRMPELNPNHEKHLAYIRKHGREYRARHKDEKQAYDRKYYDEHRDKILDHHYKYRAENRDKILDYQRKYRAEHPDEKQARDHKYYAEHRDECLTQQRKYAAERRDEIRAKKAFYQARNWEKKREYDQHRRALLKEVGFDGHWDIRDVPDWHETPEVPLNIESDLILLTSDWHIPFDKPEYVEIALGMAIEYEIPDIAIIGDFWDCDNYSRYTNFQPKETFQSEIAHVTKRLQLLINLFDNVYFCVGNHEARFLALNATGNAQGHLKYKQMMNVTGIADGYVCTDNRWMTLNDEWRLTHPKNYSQTKLRIAQRLADKYLMNVVNTHGHYTAGTPIGHAIMEPDYHIVKDRDTKATKGIFRIADIGGLFDPEKMEYLTLVDSTYPQLNPGFAIYDQGEVTIIDFEKYMNQGEISP